MSTVYVGGISPEGEHILSMFLDSFMPNTTITPLSSVGIKGKVKNHGARPDTLFLILDETLYKQCESACADVLSLPKVHKYIDDDGLKQFLISKFGPLEGVETTTTGIIPPDKLMAQAEVVQSVPEPIDTPLPEIDVTADEHVTSDNSDIIADLKDKLAQSEMMVRNLTAQLQEGGSNDEQIASLAKRIRELKDELEQKDEALKAVQGSSSELVSKLSKADRALQDVETLRGELKTAKEQYSALEFEKGKIQTALDLAEKSVKELQSKVTTLEEEKSKIQGDINELTDINSRLSTVSDDKVADLENLRKSFAEEKAQLTSDMATKDSQITELTEKVEKLSGVETELTTTKSNLEQAQLDYNNLKVDYDSLVNSSDGLKAQIIKLKEDLKAKEDEVAGKDAEIEGYKTQVGDLTSTKTKLEEQVTNLTNRVNTLIGQVNDLTAESTTKDTTISQLSQDKEDIKKEYEGKLSVLQDGISTMSDKEQELITANTKNSELTTQNEALNGQITEKDNTIAELTAKVKEQTDLVTVKDEELRLLGEDKQFIEEKLTKMTELRDNLQAQYDTLKKNSDDSVATNNSELEAKDDAITHLNNEITKLSNQVTSLTSKLETEIDTRNNLQAEVDRLKGELAEERRKHSETKAKLTDAETNSESVQLNAELADVKSKLSIIQRNSVTKSEYDKVVAELEEARNSAGNSEEVERLKSELTESRNRITELQLEMVDNADTLKEISENPFMKLAEVALPKINYEVDLGVSKPQGNFVVVAGGSLESQSSVFQIIRRSCLLDGRKRYIIVDLTIDTRIDLDFNMKNIIAPINWLNGNEPFSKFINGTKYPNIKAITIGSAYMNDLYLLNVDWSTRLQELQGIADVIIINVGCINSLVPKILFNSFSKVMKGFVITKSTPVNLRATFLSMTSLKSLSSSVVVKCYDFDKVASAPLYQKLASKFKADILKDSDALDFFKEVS